MVWSCLLKLSEDKNDMKKALTSSRFETLTIYFPLMSWMNDSSISTALCVASLAPNSQVTVISVSVVLRRSIMLTLKWWGRSYMKIQRDRLGAHAPRCNCRCCRWPIIDYVPWLINYVTKKIDNQLCSMNNHLCHEKIIHNWLYVHG